MSELTRFVAAFDLHFGWERKVSRGRNLLTPTHSPKAVAALMEFVADFKPNVFVLGGDQLNFGPVSHWNRGKPRITEGLRIKEEYDLLNKCIIEPLTKIPELKRKIWLDGNHECLSAETEVLTKRGWLKHFEITEADEIASIDENECFEFCPITGLVKKEITENLISFEDNSLIAHVTKGHRMLLAVRNSGQKRKLNFIEASETFKTPGVRYNIVTAGTNKNQNFEIANDMIAIAAWLIADGWVSNFGKAVNFAQRESTKHKITNLLDNIGISYRTVNRGQRNTHICGKKIIKQEDQWEIHLSTEQSKEILKWIPDKQILPEWVWNLSEKQVRLFIENYIDADGSRHISAGSRMIYGNNYALMSSLQALCVSSGISASLVEYRPGNYRLNLRIRKRTNLLSHSKREIETFGASNLVWCVSNKNQNIFIRLRGRVCVVGNCWLQQFIDENPETQGLVEPYIHIPELRKWEWYSQGEVAHVGKIHFVHGDTFSKNGAKYPASKLVNVYRRNIRCGHFHKFDVSTDVSVYDTRDFHTGIVVPAMAAAFPAYVKGAPSNFQQGFLFGYVAKDGTFTDYVATIYNGRFIWNNKVYGKEGNGKRR